MENIQYIDLTKWRDIKVEFFNGAYNGSAVAVLGVAVAVGGGAAVGAVAAVAAGVGALAVGAVAAAVGSEIGVTQERPSIRKLGYAFSLAAPILVGCIAGTAADNEVSDNPQNNTSTTATASANCNRDAVKDEIKKLEDAGFKITLECK
jgi:hypothetical protein